MIARTSFAMLFTAALVVGGCKAGSKPESMQVGKDVGDTAADTATLRTASAAVNDLIRNSNDCDEARPFIAKANASLDEANRLIRTATGKVTLDGLRSQIRHVEEACGK